MSGSAWRVPAALVALTVIPVVAGILRPLELTGGPVLLPTNPRVDASPAPVVLHIIAAALFALLGALQFSARLRRRRPGWHRRSGRLLVGSATAVSIVLAFTAIRRRDIPTHRAWVIRAYALAAGAGTQVLTQGTSEPAFGTATCPRRSP